MRFAGDRYQPLEPLQLTLTSPSHQLLNDTQAPVFNWMSYAKRQNEVPDPFLIPVATSFGTGTGHALTGHVSSCMTL